MERRTKTCSPSAWRSLLIAVNRKGSNLKVKKTALIEVQECHKRHSPHFAPVTDKVSLLDFIIDHDDVCGKKILREGFVPERLKRAERMQARVDRLERES